MADLELPDNTFTTAHAVLVDLGGNTIPLPAGATVEFSTDQPTILQLSDGPDSASERVGSGVLGTGTLTATPKGSIDGMFPPVAKTVEVTATAPASFDVTFDAPQPE